MSNVIWGGIGSRVGRVQNCELDTDQQGIIGFEFS